MSVSRRRRGQRLIPASATEGAVPEGSEGAATGTHDAAAAALPANPQPDAHATATVDIAECHGITSVEGLPPQTQPPKPIPTEIQAADEAGAGVADAPAPTAGKPLAPSVENT